MDNKKSSGMWGIVIVVVIIIILLVVVMKGKGPATTDTSTGTTAGDTSVAATPTEDVSDLSVDATLPPAAQMTYENAVLKYTDKRIQFDPLCHAMPAAVTLKNNVNLMLDNRSSVTVTLHLGFLGNVTIKPWGFKIVNFSSATLPRAVVIDCGTQQNVAEVQLQK